MTASTASTGSGTLEAARGSTFASVNRHQFAVSASNPLHGHPHDRRPERRLAAAGARGRGRTFAPGLSGQNIETFGQFVPGKNVIIDATALPAGITLSCGNGVRHFQINAAISTTLRGLTLTGGSSTGGNGGAGLNSGTLALEALARGDHRTGGQMRGHHAPGLDRATLANRCAKQGEPRIGSNGKMPRQREEACEALSVHRELRCLNL